MKILRQAEAEKEANRAEGKKEYKVTVEYQWEGTVTVWAEDESEAKNLARQEAEVDDGEFTYYVREILPA